VRLGKLARLIQKLTPLRLRGVRQRGVARDFEDEKVAHVREQVAAEVAQVLAARAQFFDDRERFRWSLFGDGAHDARKHLRARDSERGTGVRGLYLPLAEAYDLVEGRLRVAHRAFARARNLA